MCNLRKKNNNILEEEWNYIYPINHWFVQLLMEKWAKQWIMGYMQIYPSRDALKHQEDIYCFVDNRKIVVSYFDLILFQFANFLYDFLGNNRKSTNSIYNLVENDLIVDATAFIHKLIYFSFFDFSGIAHAVSGRLILYAFHLKYHRSAPFPIQ